MRDFTQLCNSMDYFGYESDVKLNDKKTEALIMDRVKCGQERKTPPRKNYKWPENRVKVRGVWISTDPTVPLNLNYTDWKTGQNKKSSKLLEVPTANVNWQDSGFKEPCVVLTDIYFNASGNKPEVYRRDKRHFLQFSLEHRWQD